MPTSTPTETQAYFEKEAMDFNAAYSGEPNQIQDWIRRLSYWYNKKPIAGRLNALLDLVGEAKGKQILEVGCGPGFYSIQLAQRGAQVTALDYAVAMVEAATRNAQRAGVLIDFQHGDILALPESKTFDCVFATGVAEYIAPAALPGFLQKLAKLSRKNVIVSFPKKGILHAWVRSFWLSYFKRVRVQFFDNAAIANLAKQAKLQEIDRRDVGILWVVKFQKQG